MINIINFLYEVKTGWKVETRPGNYGWYHIMWLFIMVIVTFLLTYFYGRKHDKKTDDRVVLSIGLLLFVIELYKQIFYWLEAGYYRWYAFPFQFCSIPMFIALIAPHLKEGKVKDAMYKFLGFFGFLAGFAVMVFPGSCFSTDYITILIHTMLWHASIVVLGFYVIYSKEYGKNFLKEVLPGTIIYALLVLFAVIVNIVGYKLYFGTPNNVHGETLFFLYLSPYYGCPFPILGTLKEQVPYIVFLICYVLAFAIGISIVWCATLGIRKLALRNKKNENEVG
ncbi:MAG: YwaF family protein [Bacilli bacterium]|nr:YwaF family protein [Bacilli bacterium]